MRNINDLRAFPAPKAPVSSRNNQKESSEFKYLVAAQRLASLRASLVRNRKSLQLLSRSVFGSFLVLKKVPFPLKNLNYWASFQLFKMQSPHTCDLGFGLSLSNEC